MTKSAPTIVVLDDDITVLNSLGRLLRVNGFTVRTHLTPEEFFAAGPPSLPACLLLDQHLGHVTGLEVHAEMRWRGWEVPTIFLTADYDAHTVVKAMRAGANNYVTKPYDPDELLSLVKECCARGFEELLQRSETAELRRRASQLTSRERTIVSLVAKGMLNKQIADHLRLAVVTVKLHRSHAMQKLGAKNSAELARISLSVGL